jgi:hypothetical protein
LSEGLLNSEAAGEEHAIGSARATAPCSSADASRKRRVRPGLPEEVEECGRSNQTNGRAAAVRPSEAEPEGARGQRLAASGEHDTAPTRGVRIGYSTGYSTAKTSGRRNDNSQRITAGRDKFGGNGVGFVGSEKHRVGWIDVDGAIQMNSARPLIARAQLPATGKHTFDREVGLLGVAVFKI